MTAGGRERNSFSSGGHDPNRHTERWGQGSIHLDKLNPSKGPIYAFAVCAALWGCLGSTVVIAADGREPLVFRVKPVQQPAFEEMAEPDRVPPPARTAPLALTPRNLNYGSAAASPGTPAAFRAPPASVSVLPPVASQASLPATAMSSGKVVQIGAFRSRAEAEKALGNWRRETAALQRVAEPTIVAADLGEKGIYYRVRVPGFSDSRKAGEFCGEYKGPGRDCYVVP